MFPLSEWFKPRDEAAVPEAEQRLLAAFSRVETLRIKEPDLATCIDRVRALHEKG